MIDWLARLLTRKTESAPVVTPSPTSPTIHHRIYGTSVDREKYPALAKFLDGIGPPAQQNLELIAADTIQHCREQYLHEVRGMEYGQLIAKYNIDPLDLLAWQMIRGLQGKEDPLQAIKQGEYKGIIPIDFREAVFITGIAGTVINTLMNEKVIDQFVGTLKQDQEYLLRIIAQTYQK